NGALARALQGGKHLTRDELARVLQNVGIRAQGQRLGHLMMRAELDAVICSGPRRGKQFTYALLDERVAAAPKLRCDEALAKLTQRYFASHGPALMQDYAWWSGLSVTDAKRGIEMCRSDLQDEVAEGKTYWLMPSRRRTRADAPPLLLLPNYDEYVIAYKDRTAHFDMAVQRKLDPRNTVLANHIIVLNGKVIGGWRRVQDEERRRGEGATAGAASRGTTARTAGGRRTLRRIPGRACEARRVVVYPF
ncbi:MAG: DNA glycosylase AlkZ-like family protein, partial [Steroidobacteraceae bacterium]